jgi:hypothetical protein
MIKKKSQISGDSRLAEIGNRVRALRKANTNILVPKILPMRKALTVFNTPESKTEQTLQ